MKESALLDGSLSYLEVDIAFLSAETEKKKSASIYSQKAIDKWKEEEKRPLRGKFLQSLLDV